MGSVADSAPVEARLAPAERGRLHHIRLEMRHATITIAPGQRYAAWTFDGRVPGPTLHVRQGDTVDFTLVNHGFRGRCVDRDDARVRVRRAKHLHVQHAEQVVRTGAVPADEPEDLVREEAELRA